MYSQADDSTLRLQRWLETLTVSIAVPLFGFIVHRADPYLTTSAFPWLVLLPLIVGATHGRAPGMVSAALLGAGASVHAFRFHTLRPELASWIVGCVVTGAVAGYFCDVARRRRWLLDERADGLVVQLERSQRARQVLALSHAHLEERTANVGASLEAVLQEAQQRMAALRSGAELGQVLLEVLARQGIVQAASLFRVRDPQSLSEAPIAQLGAARTSSEPHPLVLRALQTLDVASNVDAETRAGTYGPDWSVLAALPISTASGCLVGVIAVHRMPFMALAPEQLHNTMLLANHLADFMEERLHAVGADAVTAKHRLPRALATALQRAASADAMLPSEQPAPVTPRINAQPAGGTRSVAAKVARANREARSAKPVSFAERRVAPASANVVDTEVEAKTPTGRRRPFRSPLELAPPPPLGGATGARLARPGLHVAAHGGRPATLVGALKVPKSRRDPSSE